MDFPECEFEDCTEKALITIQKDRAEGGGLVHSCRDHRNFFNQKNIRDPRRRDRGTMLDWHESRSDYGLDSDDLRHEPKSDNLIEGF